MTRTQYALCPLCEASCGLAVELDGERIAGIRGDTQNPFSRGHICPKALGLKDIHEDPDRLRRPLRRRGTDWEEIEWDEALDEAAARIVEVQREHGQDAVAFYVGNPTGHSYSALLGLSALREVVKTRSVFSSASVDGLPRTLVASLLYGNQATIPIADIDRTDFLLILGANPLVSNGSIMTAPDFKKRLQRLQRRGGTFVVIDPRRSETAQLADAHHFIRPGTDALLLAALLRTIFREGWTNTTRLAPHLEQLEALERAMDPFTAERVAPITGIGAGAIRELAQRFGTSRTAVCYGRMGISAQEFGAVATWLIDALNIVTGNFDRPGGAMFNTPAADLPGIARVVGQTGEFARWTSRVSGKPEFNGELPVAAFAEEMETAGEGQIRGLITHAGNPVLSLPNGPRLDAAISKLDFVLCLDIYLNETTRHADIILPPTFGLEKEQYPLLFFSLGVRNFAQFAPAVVPASPGARGDYEIMMELVRRIGARRGGLQSIGTRAVKWLAGRWGARGALDLILRLGPYGLSIADLEAAPHGVDLGPLEPRLPRILNTPDKKIRLMPTPIADDLTRLRARLEEGRRQELTLVSRRHLHSNNSWMHNCQRLVKGKDRCTLLMNPLDAEERGLGDGVRARVQSRTGSIVVPVVLSDEVMRGTVNMPHGWGHDVDGARQGVARKHAGVSVNELVDDARTDRLSGASALNSAPVSVSVADR